MEADGEVSEMLADTWSFKYVLAAECGAVGGEVYAAAVEEAEAVRVAVMLRV